MKQWIQLFIRSAGVVLLTAALERFLVAIGDAQTLSLPEPVIGIPLHYAVLVVGILEWIVAMICLFGQRTSLQLGWIAWMAANYWVYRIGLLTMHCHQKGACVGRLTDPLHLARGGSGIFLSIVPAYLLMGSCVALAWLWLGARRFKDCHEEKAKSIKMSCPSCGRHIKFGTENLGQKIFCPQCQAVITLRKPEETLKISCFFCKEHIEFPSHATGEKMPCPHCKMDITLKEPA